MWYQFNTAFNIARQGDIVAWRKIIRQAKQPIPIQLEKLRMKYEKNPPKREDDLQELSYEGVSIYAPLFCIALVGVESGRAKLNNQISVLDDILHPKEWNRSGLPYCEST
jgi:hypothetical protein